jgi:UDP-glucose 4-epimerase
VLSAGPALVTGGAGFIGASLIRRLCERGTPVTAVDRLPRARATRLHGLGREQGLTYVEAGLDDGELLARAAAGHATVFHLAANTENRSDRAGSEADVRQTVAGTAALLRALEPLPEATIVIASSQLVYAPAAEGEWITEASGRVAPATPFAAGKVAAEAFLQAHCREHGHRGAVCRLANVVGPEMLRGIVRDLVAEVEADPRRLRVLGDGRQTRSYLHVDDCVEALILAAEQPHGHAVYNVCNLDAISAATVAEIIAGEVAGEPPEICFEGGERGWRGDVPTLRVRPEALLGVGWRPSMGSGAAVRATARAMLGAPAPPVPATPGPPPRAAAERWEVLGRSSLYESEWVGLSLVTVKPPEREPYDHHVVTLPAAVGAVVACPRKGVLLLHRHRFITDSVGYEIPAGGVDGSESIKAAAEREVLEETGWRLAGVDRLVSCNVSDGVSDQRFHLVLAGPEGYAGTPVDQHESTSLTWVDRVRIREMIRDGEIPGALSMVALLYAMQFGRV